MQASCPGFQSLGFRVSKGLWEQAQQAALVHMRMRLHEPHVVASPVAASWQPMCSCCATGPALRLADSSPQDKAVRQICFPFFLLRCSALVAWCTSGQSPQVPLRNDLLDFRVWGLQNRCSRERVSSLLQPLQMPLHLLLGSCLLHARLGLTVAEQLIAAPPAPGMPLRGSARARSFPGPTGGSGGISRAWEPPGGLAAQPRPLHASTGPSGPCGAGASPPGCCLCICFVVVGQGGKGIPELLQWTANPPQASWCYARSG